MNQMVKNLLTLNQLEFGNDEDSTFERFDIAALDKRRDRKSVISWSQQA